MRQSILEFNKSNPKHRNKKIKQERKVIFLSTKLILTYISKERKKRKGII